MIHEPLREEYSVIRKRECRRLLEALEESGTATSVRCHASGSLIRAEGERDHDLHIVIDGLVRVVHPRSSGREAILGLLGPWDVFGYLFVDESVRRSRAEAVTRCRITKIPKTSVERVLRQRPEVALGMVTLLETRLVEYGDLAGRLLPRRTEHRLAGLLPILARRFGKGNPPKIDLRLTHQDLANMIGATRESVTNTLMHMRYAKMVAVEDERIVLLDVGKLNRLSCHQAP